MILEQDWEPEQIHTPSSAYGNKWPILCIGGALLAIAAAFTGIRFLVKCVKSAPYINADKAIITITPINPINPNTPSAPTFQDIRRSPSYFETPERTNSTIQELTQLNSRMKSFANYKANSINRAINLCNLMGSNLEESTQGILDSYLEETLEMNMNHPSQDVGDFFNLYSNQEETLEMNDIPDDTDHPFQGARLC